MPDTNETESDPGSKPNQDGSDPGSERDQIGNEDFEQTMALQCLASVEALAAGRIYDLIRMKPRTASELIMGYQTMTEIALLAFTGFDPDQVRRLYLKETFQ